MIGGGGGGGDGHPMPAMENGAWNITAIAAPSVGWYKQNFQHY